MPMFGEDAEGVIWVFYIPTRAWKAIGFWCAIAFFVEAPDVLKGLQTAAINLGMWVAVIWVVRLMIWVCDMAFRQRRRD